MVLAGRAAAAALVAGPLGLSRPRIARGSTPLDELRRAIAARDGSVLGPGDAGFQNARRDYNLRFDTVPQAIVRCRTVAGVQAAVQWANAHDVPVFVRAGGHSYEGTSGGDGLVTDVRPPAASAGATSSARTGARARPGGCHRARRAAWRASRAPAPRSASRASRSAAGTASSRARSDSPAIRSAP